MKLNVYIILAIAQYFLRHLETAKFIVTFFILKYLYEHKLLNKLIERWRKEKINSFPDIQIFNNFAKKITLIILHSPGNYLRNSKR